jgi:hypothetical protein
MQDRQDVHSSGNFGNSAFGPVYGKARRATDAPVILSIRVSDRGVSDFGLPDVVIGFCTGETRHSRRTHRSHRIADIERQIVRCSAEEQYHSDET